MGRNLSKEKASWLERPFAEEEIKGVVFPFVADKALGQNGFTMAFSKECWEVKFVLIDLLREVHSHGNISKSRNSTFITLPLKKARANRIQDFRSISFVSAPYKIITEVLSNRVQEVLLDVIDGNQYAFIKGRQILDSILIANECVEDYTRRKHKGVVVKIDRKSL